MCGICGIWHFDNTRQVEVDVLHTMSTRLTHRGPDDSGYRMEGNVAFGFRRLSIVDANGSHQPLINEAGSQWLVCNGEIYNHHELRRQLQSKHWFRTVGDIEPILHLYEEFGLNCVPHLRGMFAFALWDSRLQQLVLSVDRFGKKPLYYSILQGKVIFASELKSLLAYPGISRQLDFVALDEYLANGYITAPRSIFTSIRKLPPAHMLVVNRAGCGELIQYWTPEFATPDQYDSRSFSDIAAELTELLLESVRLRLMGEQPVGAFLSGGIDSSTVVALMRQLSAEPIKTFSVAFHEAAYDESPYAKIIAERCNTDHHVVTVRSREACDLLPYLVQHLDEPFADSSMIPTYILAQCASEHHKVILGGDGGDEVFGGYFQHLYGYRHLFVKSLIPSSMQPASAQLAGLLPHFMKIKPYLVAAGQSASCWLSKTSFFSAEQRRQLYAEQAGIPLEAEQLKADVFARVAHLDELSQLQYHDLLRYLPGDILVKIDRAAMFASLEVRAPLLDHKLFEFMARVPPNYRVGLRFGKRLLRAAVAQKLPRATLHRPKQGFSIPQAEWLRTAFKPLLHDMLRGSTTHGLFNRTVITQLLDEHERGDADHKDRLWALLCFELWAQKNTLS